MSIHTATPWHKASFDTFVFESLPQLLAERLPVTGYQVTEADNGTLTILVDVEGVHVEYPAIPRPDEAGVFQVKGEPRVVIPIATHEELDTAEVACVGEQICAYIEERLGQASNDVKWSAEFLRAWLPLDRWILEFLQAKSQRVDDTNFISHHTHLRRMIVANRQKVIASGQFGRVCPFETPEGPNIGRVFTVAVGAEIRNGRLVIIDSRPEASLGLSASLLPFLEHNDPNRVLMAANMMRQGIVPEVSEPAWVQTGNEPDAPGVWCGRNLLTAFISWGVGTSEDGIILSQSAAQRMNDPFLVEPGDKLANRHGAKGVVSYILPDDQMPHLPDGTPVELVYNFPGLRTRMHIGQVREAVMSRIARLEGIPAIVLPFHAPSMQELGERLASAGLPTDGMERLTEGKNGPPLEYPSTVGWVYWNRLMHLAKDKIQVTSDEAQGQTLGELEFTVLREVGATRNYEEAVNTRSARRPDAATLAKKISQGVVEQAGPPTPMFADLTRRLQIAGIRAEIKGRRLIFRLAPPEGDPLTLVHPLPHPWLHDYPLEAVGAIPEDKGDEGKFALPSAEYARLVDANARLRHLLSSKAPTRLIKEAETRLKLALEAFFDALLPGEIIRMEEPQLFSGRAVATPGEDLHLDQVGLPGDMCWSLFGPFVQRALGHESSIRRDDPDTVKVLKEVMDRSWVIIQHDPALTVTSLVAFHPVLEASHAIRLNPLVCNWLNADFDGDQVAVFLPVTPGGQEEAGEILSVAGQLNHDPALIRGLIPPHEALWGLAYRSLKPEGRGEMAQMSGVPEEAFSSILTLASFADLMALILKREGVEITLEVLERLVDYGYKAVRASGASMSPFIGSSVCPTDLPEEDDPVRWEVYTEELTEKILSSTDYLDADLGPQLLDARIRAWGRRSLPMVVGVRGVVIDARGKPAIVRHNYSEGLSPVEMYACVAGARQGFAQLNVQGDQMVAEALKRSDPVSLNVLARARRSRYPGAVFARAAANGEVDPLEDGDSRRMVGIL